MADPAAVQAVIADVEAAIQAGRLEEADSALQTLKPLLAEQRVDDLLRVRSQLDDMVLRVRTLQSKDRLELATHLRRRGAIDRYRQQQQASTS